MQEQVEGIEKHSPRRRRERREKRKLEAGREKRLEA